MSPALRAPSIPQGLSELADEFKRLDHDRRTRGLSPNEAGRYHTLFERLSDTLAQGERNRRVDTRQFLRVPFHMTLTIRRADGTHAAACHDFGGGGCAIATPGDLRFELDDDVWLDGAEIEGETHPLHGRATIVWTRLPTGGEPARYGLKFCIDADEERDQIDRLFYRVLDRFLTR
ncbi:MAG TPA: PilZ domain-containing protein [Polyangia bacterium]|nr:PilZ domain-containing protein [Polyangia bacterium]